MQRSSDIFKIENLYQNKKQIYFKQCIEHIYIYHCDITSTIISCIISWIPSSLHGPLQNNDKWSHEYIYE